VVRGVSCAVDGVEGGSEACLFEVVLDVVLGDLHAPGAGEASLHEWICQEGEMVVVDADVLVDGFKGFLDHGVLGEHAGGDGARASDRARDQHGGSSGVGHHLVYPFRVCA